MTTDPGGLASGAGVEGQAAFGEAAVNESRVALDVGEASAEGAGEDGFRLRNRYLHGYWIYDDESYQWLTLKGAHRSDRPEITFIDSSEVWELAERFQKLCFSLLHWDTAHFGEPADEEDGHQGLVSRKQI